MAIITKSLSLSTRGNTDIIDITDKVERVLHQVKLRNGVVTVSVAGSTAGVTTCEFEPGVVEDLKKTFESLIPEHKGYAHDRGWKEGNAHSHLRASIIGPSLTISFSDGRLNLGTWQQIVFIDFDNRPRQREILLQFIGE